MTLLEPWGLLGLLSVPLVVVIHLFQRRYRRRHIAGLFLWQAERPVSASGRKVRPPRRSLSLLCELLACVAASLLLAGATCTHRPARTHVVCVLDGSASMQSRTPPGDRFIDRALQALRDELLRRGADCVTVIQSSPVPRVLLGPEAPVASLSGLPEALTPSRRSHSLAPALSLARSIGPQDPLLVLTDHMPEHPVPQGAVWIAVGEPLSNVAFTSAGRIALNEREDLLRLTVTSYGGGGEVTVTLRPPGQGEIPGAESLGNVEGKKFFLRRKVLARPTATLSLTIPASVPCLVAELPSDCLSCDNRLYLPSTRKPPVRCAVLCAGADRALLQRAIRSIDGATLSLPEQADFLFVPYALRNRAPRGAWVCVFPPFRSEGEKKLGFQGPYTLALPHPAVEAVSLERIVWCASEVPPPPAGVPLIACGTVPLLYELPGPEKAFVFNCRLSYSNLGRTQAFPVLIHNLIALRQRELPGPEPPVAQTGTTVRLAMPPATERSFQVQGATFRKEFSWQPEVFLSLPQEPQLLGVRAAGKLLFLVGCNFIDPEESDLRKASTGRATGDPLPSEKLASLRGPLRQRESPLFWILLALCALLVCANWYLWKREEEA